MEHCQRCSKPYRYVWKAPNELWTRVTGKKEDGLYCIPCFDIMAQEKKCAIIYWQCNEGGWR